MKLSKSIFVGLILLLFVVGVFVASCLALEGKAGEVIRTEADLKELEAKGLLTHAQVIAYTEMVKDFGLTISIVETKDRSIVEGRGSGSKSYWKATVQNRGKAGIGRDDLLVNYGGAGLPFPDIKSDDPQAAAKAAWNYDLKHEGSDFYGSWTFFLTDSQGNLKKLRGNTNRLFWDFRTDVPPKGKLFPKDPQGIWYKEIIDFDEPFSSKGLGQLQIKYIDPTRENDLWIYVPGLRRNMRVGGGNRCDSLGGFVHNFDDAFYWAGDTSKFSWKFLDEKEHLVLTSRAFEEVKKGQTYYKGMHQTLPKLERRKVWVIEQTPKFEGYCYLKRIYHQDIENWRFLISEMYDRAGSLWKLIELADGIFPNPEETGGGITYFNITGATMDLKIWEAGPYYFTKVKINSGLPPQMFSLDAMRRKGR